MPLASLGDSVMVVAPHPDDETLGAGGTLSRLGRDGVELHWLIVTEMSKSASYSAERIASREREIGEIAGRYGFASVKRVGREPARLTPSDVPGLVDDIGRAFDAVRPSAVLATSPGDAHSDHAIVFSAVNAAAKSFRRPFVEAVLLYETLSETGYNLDPSVAPFRPNFYVRLEARDIEAKLGAMSVFAGETAPFPFPRSGEAITALAKLRGSECNAPAAEAFMALKMVS